MPYYMLVYQMSNCPLIFCFVSSEFPSAASWPQPAWHHHQICWYGKERNQQTSQTEGEEERVKDKGSSEKNEIETNLS